MTVSAERRAGDGYRPLAQTKSAHALEAIVLYYCANARRAPAGLELGFGLGLWVVMLAIQGPGLRAAADRTEGARC
jgi:hypothetical protein